MAASLPQGPLRPQPSNRQSVQTRQRQLLRDGVGGLGFMATLALTQAFSQAVNAAGATTSKQLLALGEVFKRVQTDRNARTEIHGRIARLAQTSTVAAYGALVTGQEGPASATHYRAGAGRMAAGKMLDALQSPGFIEYSSDGINFANTAVLDRTAAQWHRLNFGAAGSRQGNRAAVFEVRFNNLVVAALGFNEPPSPGFVMPRGVFTTPEGGRVKFGANPAGADVFQPSRTGYFSGKATAGIMAKNFFDAGLARIANELGPAYQDYYAQLFARAKEGKGPLRDHVLVKPKAQPVLVNRIAADASF